MIKNHVVVKVQKLQKDVIRVWRGKMECKKCDKLLLLPLLLFPVIIVAITCQKTGYFSLLAVAERFVISRVARYAVNL